MYWSMNKVNDDNELLCRCLPFLNYDDGALKVCSKQVKYYSVAQT